MTFGEKLAALRRERQLTQEQLAELLGVSRQSVSKWEGDLAYPETDKLIRLSGLFGCSLDYLLRDAQPQQAGERPARRPLLRERKSEKSWRGQPLWHIGRNARGVVAVGLNARGIVAVGLNARGLISFGLLSLGLFSFGFCALGLCAFGLLAIGCLSAGCFSAGVLAAGAISFGLISLGAVAVGGFSAGALAVGKYAALGDHARALVALGDTRALGSLYQNRLSGLSAQQLAEARRALEAAVPAWLGWAGKLFSYFFF